MARVTLDRVRKVYRGGIVALEALDLAVAHGEFVCVLGLSGSGKSTVLKLIAGIEEVTAGHIALDDDDVTTRPPERRDVAMVFQSYALYPTMSVFDNIAFPLRLRKLDRGEIRRRVEQTAEMLGIGGLLRRRPRELSGGERQRVALGRAVIRQPRLFLLDEPLSNLDATLRVQMRQELRRLHTMLGATFVYVTHDQDDALIMGDRVAVLAQGRLQQYGSPTDVFDTPANRFVASFIGRVPTNFVDGMLARENDTLVFHGVDFTVRLPALDVKSDARQLVLGVRPEALLVAPTDTQGLVGRVESVSVVQPNIYVNVLVGSHTFVARVPDNLTCPRTGESVPLRVDVGRANLFDPLTGARVPLVARTATLSTTSHQVLEAR